MNLKEKAINGLECCTSLAIGICSEKHCPYWNDCWGEGAPGTLLRDALAALKNEPVKPKHEHSGGYIKQWYACGACGTTLNHGDKYCHECGRAVKWE